MASQLSKAEEQPNGLERRCLHCGNLISSQASSRPFCGKAISGDSVVMPPAAASTGDSYSVAMETSSGVAIGDNAQAAQVSEVHGSLIQAQGAVNGSIMLAPGLVVRDGFLIDLNDAEKD
jgi:hypothetical protein